MTYEQRNIATESENVVFLSTPPIAEMDNKRNKSNLHVHLIREKCQVSRSVCPDFAPEQNSVEIHQEAIHAL